MFSVAESFNLKVSELHQAVIILTGDERAD